MFLAFFQSFFNELLQGRNAGLHCRLPSQNLHLLLQSFVTCHSSNSFLSNPSVDGIATLLQRKISLNHNLSDYTINNELIYSAYKPMDLNTWVYISLFFIYDFLKYKQTSASCPISHSLLCFFSVKISQLRRLMLTEFNILWKQ